LVARQGDATAAHGQDTMSRRHAISAPDAPAAIGPYSPAIRAGNLLFISGQVAIDPASGVLIDGDVAAQTAQVMRNLGALLAAAGAGFEHVVRTTVFLADMNDFSAMNAVYGEYVVDPPPARATVQVTRLPKDARVEIDLIAVLA
jgi:2-iminobutanoate/2-iminopropanoate deaminase